ncbi:acetyl-CoA C-acyltransferase [Corynebacterium striatum]|uniref:Probable acetyl-CoA acetyltransferase n=1 Tax=Corynebacterium striatum TaxID=43770 RepID=A0ABX7DGP1_CORST|nr:acetyl-CoA C-acyltransferase [Corynebacterium striatum]EGT5576331.1 acetyl-CoA C-acyltransferase [Corynebacterium striatum]EGT5788333.1 acetyl-CoA C-acyltransferase [Corynebacterium striatum]KAA1265096.1 acetyl-CoA C-acyltransferase [Corynebacterium striatum]MDK8788988.1 acetyl-CoA C-acyltransferase [Corynebacterium striatum]MDK8806857.1 acetyl-CoA C-acyltransferase [Corynebacterium striatum]
MTLQDTDIVIVGAARTPFGKLLGGLAALPATDLGAHAIRGALEQARVEPELVDAVVFGQVLQAGVGQNPTKQAALAAGISPRAHTATVNKICLSGLTAVIDAARLLRAGEAEVVVAGGMESMTNAPHLLPRSRAGVKFGAFEALDHMEHDGLRAADLGISMGSLSEKYAGRYPVTREEQDHCAALSHQRALAATQDGTLAREIVPLIIETRKGSVTVESDEGIREGVTDESLAKLRPAFEKDGSITAGNSSPITDGAAAVVLTTTAHAAAQGWAVLAALRSVGQTAGPDSSLQQQPADALLRALEREGWDAGSLDHVEINEAFAAVVVHSARTLGLDPDAVNPQGGAIAMGHPIGASGARLVVHAAHQLAAGAGSRAGVALCGGGGQGEALLLEAK